MGVRTAPTRAAGGDGVTSGGRLSLISAFVIGAGYGRRSTILYGGSGGDLEWPAQRAVTTMAELGSGGGSVYRRRPPAGSLTPPCACLCLLRKSEGRRDNLSVG